MPALTLTPQVVTLDADGVALQLNQSPWSVMKMELSPGAVERTMVGDSQGNGQMPVGEETTGNIVARLWLRAIGTSGLTMDTELNLGQTLAKVCADAVTRPGERMALDYRPPNTSQTNRLRVYAAEVSEVPNEMDGEMLGWYHGSPVYVVTLTCAPFIYGDLVTLTATGSGLRREIEVSNVPGDVDAEGELYINGSAGTTLWGLESEGFTPAAGHATRLTIGAGLTEIGTTELKPQTAPQAVRSIDSINLQGPKRVTATITESSPIYGMEFRLLWRADGGAWNTGAWVDHPRVTGNNRLSSHTYGVIDFGVINVPKSASGGASAVTGLIQCRRTNSRMTFAAPKITVVEILPAERFAVVRKPMDALPPRVQLGAFDNFPFSGAPTNLHGTTAPIGGNWTTGGSATDFATVSGVPYGVRRSSGLDATAAATNLPAGRLATLPVVNANVGVGITFNFTTTNAACVVSLLFRYVSSTDWIRVELTASKDDNVGTQYLQIVTQDAKGGTISPIYTDGRVEVQPSSFLGADHDFDVLTNGAYLYAYLDGELVGFFSINNSNGPTAGGSVGFIDQGKGTGTTRTYKEFRVWDWDGVTKLGNLKLTHDNERQYVGGVYAPTPSSVGSRVLIPPAGARNKSSRIVTRQYAGDPFAGGFYESVTEYNYTAQLKYRPRYRLPRGA